MMKTKFRAKYKLNTLTHLLFISLFIFYNTCFAQEVPEIVFKKPTEVKLDTLFFDFGNGELSKTVNFKNESGIIGTGNKLQIWKYQDSKFNIICNNKAWSSIGNDYKGQLPFNNDLPLFKIFFSPDFKSDMIETIHFYTDNQNKVDTVYSAIFSYPYLKLSSDKLHFRLEIAKDSALNSTIQVQNIGLDTLILRVNTKNNSDLISFSKSNYTVFPQSTLDIPIRVSIPGSIKFDENDSIRIEESLIFINTQFPKNKFVQEVVVDIIKSKSGISLFNLLIIIFVVILVFIVFFLIRTYKKSPIFFIFRLKKYLKKFKNKDQYVQYLNRAAIKFLPTKRKISESQITSFVQECIIYSHGAILKEEDINAIFKKTNPNFEKANSIFKEMKDSYLTNIVSKNKVHPDNRLKTILNDFLRGTLRDVFDDILENKTNHNTIESLSYQATIEKINSVFEEDKVELNTYKQIIDNTKKKFAIDDNATALKLITDSIEICSLINSIKNNLKKQKDPLLIINSLNENKKIIEVVSKNIGYRGENTELLSWITNWFKENQKLMDLANYSKVHFNTSNNDSALSIMTNAVNVCLKVKKGEIGSLLSSGKDDNFCIEMLQKDTSILQDSYATLKGNNFYEIKSNQYKEDLPEIISDILYKAEKLELKLNSTLSYAGVFKQVLLKFNESIVKISTLQNWDEQLKRAFLKHFDKKNNGIEILLLKINNLEDSKTIKENVPLDSILYTLTEIFRIYAFCISRCKYITDVLNRINFPYNEYIANSTMLKGIILSIYNINLIIPKVFEDKYDKNIHENYTGPYVVLRDAPLTIFENLYSPTVIDIYNIGYERNNEILKKPEVYLRSK